MSEERKYVFGPVPSRRLGLSLGVDIVGGGGEKGVSSKVCTLDCVYCQLGRTVTKTIERKEYVSVEAVLGELKARFVEGVEADFVTISGLGEPTLNVRLGEIIDGIKRLTNIPVAILTNGTLLYMAEVRADCAKADVVLPSLDAGDDETFEKINRPHRDISIEKLISGLCAFRDEFTGQIWLEVFFVEGLNTGDEQIYKIRDAIGRIRPDKVQVNTAVRPTAERGVGRVESEKLRAIAAKLGERCEVVADFSGGRGGGDVDIGAEEVLSMLKRRPCSLEDVCSGLGIELKEAERYIVHLQEEGVVYSVERDGIVFFRVK